MVIGIDTGTITRCRICIQCLNPFMMPVEGSIEWGNAAKQLCFIVQLYHCTTFYPDIHGEIYI